MPFAVKVPRELVAKKPRFGDPCNSCGLCCYGRLCDLGQRVFGRLEGPCPALQFDEEKKSSCGLVTAPEQHVPLLALIRGAQNLSDATATLINAGRGCDMRLAGETNEAYSRSCDEYDRSISDKIDAAKDTWGMPWRTPSN